MLHDRGFRVRRVGRYEIFPWFELRAFGLLVRWGHLGVIAQAGPFGVCIEPVDDREE